VGERDAGRPSRDVEPVSAWRAAIGAVPSWLTVRVAVVAALIVGIALVVVLEMPGTEPAPDISLPQTGERGSDVSLDAPTAGGGIRGPLAPRPDSARASERVQVASGAPARPAASPRAAARPAPVQTVAPAPAPPGRMLVRSLPPGARVRVDGQARGETPVAVRGLTLGPHTLTVTAPGLPAWEREVTLTADRPAQSFEVGLGAAGAGEAPAVAAPAPPTQTSPADQGPAAAAQGPAVQIDSRPAGAQVWLDGRLVGTTPLVFRGVDAGSHAIRLELPGYRSWTTSVNVAPGAGARVAASLEP
jgi:hypothetical protein